MARWQFLAPLAEALALRESVESQLDDERKRIRKVLRKPSFDWKTLRTSATSTLEYLVELSLKDKVRLPCNSRHMNGNIESVARAEHRLVRCACTYSLSARRCQWVIRHPPPAIRHPCF